MDPCSVQGCEQPETTEQAGVWYCAAHRPPESPSLETQLAQEREARLRAEGEATALRGQLSKPAARPSPPDESTLTVPEIEALVRSGELSDAQGARLIARIETREEIRRETARTQAARVQASLATRLSEYVAHHPELKDRASPLMRRVADQLAILEEQYGMDPEDPRTQVLAVEREVGGGSVASRQPQRDIDRERRPTGNMGGPADLDTERVPKTPGERLWNLLLPQYQEFYLRLPSVQGDRARAIKMMAHADEDLLRRRGRLKLA